MAVVVVDEAEGVVDEFGGEAEGVVAGAGAGEGGGAEGGVVNVGDGGVGRADGDDIGDILIAIVHQEGGGLAILPEGERARGDGLGGVPDELLVDIPRAVGEELLDAEIAVVEEDGVSDLHGTIHLAVGDAATEAVKGHRDDLRPLRPTDRPVLGVILHLPNAGRRLSDTAAITIVGETYAKRAKYHVTPAGNYFSFRR